MAFNSDLRFQRDTPRNAFTLQVSLIVITAIFIITVIVGVGGYLLGTQIPKKAAKQQNRSLVSSPSLSPTPRALATNKIDAVLCIDAVNRMVNRLPDCKGLSGAEHKICGEKRKAIFATLKNEAKTKLDACINKYSSSFPNELKPGENLDIFLNPFVKLETTEKQRTEDELFIACDGMNAAIKAYYEKAGEYPGTLSALIPQYSIYLPPDIDNYVYERSSPDKFDYIIFLDTGAEFTVTQDDLFDTYHSPSVVDRCVKWSQQRSLQ